MIDAFPENQSSNPSTHISQLTTTFNYRSRENQCPLQTTTYMWHIVTQIHIHTLIKTK